MAEQLAAGLDVGEPAKGVFELARKLLNDHSHARSHADHERLKKDTAAMIRAGYIAKDKLYDELAPKDKFDLADLQETTTDGMRYKTAERLLAKATAMMMARQKKNRGAEFQPEEVEDPQLYVGLELDQLFVRIFEGWKPSAAGAGLVEKIFSGRVKGPETLGFLMQIYAVANNGGPGAVGAEELAQQVDVRHGKNQLGDERTKIIVPAVVIKAALDNEVQRGL